MDSITDLSFTSDQEHIVAAGSDKSLRLWDIGTARERHTLTGHSDKVRKTPKLRSSHFQTPLACHLSLMSPCSLSVHNVAILQWTVTDSRCTGN